MKALINHLHHMFFSFFDRNVSFKKKKNNVVANLYTKRFAFSPDTEWSGIYLKDIDLKRFEKNVLSFYSFIKHFLREFVF